MRQLPLAATVSLPNLVVQKVKSTYVLLLGLAKKDSTVDVKYMISFEGKDPDGERGIVGGAERLLGQLSDEDFAALMATEEVDPIKAAKKIDAEDKAAEADAEKAA